ncbi:MAG: patatin-like phospholipase family protein [Candidatus Rokubacteria bacterium]|nr:patatin-like phospholipase family protein [Candidatus Rokubacteria bacterium]
MQIFRRALSLLRSRPRRRYALALAGGGVIGGMYEVGALAALEERLERAWKDVDLFVGCSAGAVVAALVANGVPAREIYRILDEDLPDPLNFTRTAVYASDSFRHAFGQFGRLLWAFGKNAVVGLRASIPDMLAHAEADLPAGFFSLVALERFLRESFAARGLANSFGALEHTLLIPAVDLDRATRVVFGRGELRDVPISHAIAASSAIPGFFEPYHLDGRDYVDGGVGFSGHADLAAEMGAQAVIIVNPLVPSISENSGGATRARGLYSIVEQANRIYSQNLLQLDLAVLRDRYPHVDFFLLQPESSAGPLLGPSMGFEASRAALRYGYTSTRAWLDGQGDGLVSRLLIGPHAAAVGTM